MGQVAHGGHGEDGPVVAHQVELAHVQAGLLPRRPHVARGHVLGHVLSACHDALHLTGHAPAQRAADCFTQLQFAVHSRASNEPSRRFVLNVKAIVPGVPQYWFHFVFLSFSRVLEHIQRNF